MGDLQRRLTAIAGAVLVIVLAATAVGLVVAQRWSLTDALDTSLRRRAGDLVALVEAGDLPPTLGISDDDDAVQIVAPDGEVVAASAGIAGAPPLADALPGGGEHIRQVERPAVDEGPVRLLTRTLADGTTVHVAASSDDIDEAVATLVQSLAVGVPVLALLLTAAVWWLVGRTLRPVEAAARRQQRFVADAAHELRSPLTRMRAELEVDLAHPAGADPAATHRSALEEVVGLQHLVDDLLLLARGGPGRQGAVDVGALVGPHGSTDDGDLVVVGDGAALARAIGNVVENAERHARSSVRVRAARAGDEVVVTVADDGPGIPAADRERVFERFTRLDEARAAGAGGAGLGLAIAREVVERHGGRVEVVDGDELPGACVRLTLPARAP